MISIRERKTSRSLAQSRKMIEISASGDNIPMWKSGGVKNCSNRYCILPKCFEKVTGEILDFTVRDDDVFVVTMPKCGTTWMQEAAWLILNDLDYEKAGSVNQAERSVFMDLSGIYEEMPRSTVKAAAQLSSPRLIKTHLPANLLPKGIWPKKCKLIYVARNAKDVAVSFYHFHKGLGTWFGNIEEFVKDFIEDELMYTPFWPHVMDFWQMRNEPNIFFTTYEAMMKNLPGILKDLTKFLEKPELSEQQMEKLLNHLSFNKMKENLRTNPTAVIKADVGHSRVLPDFQFMRRGIVGCYKDELPEQCRKDIDAWTVESLKGYNVTVEEIFGEISQDI